MSKVYYDLHIHSCLSPCADIDMTPNNIVQMAKLNGLQLIAVTDHNSCKNCRAIIEVGKREGICVVPGMEICTSEDIHAICLFPNIGTAELFDGYVKDNSVSFKNKPEIFGEQIIMDSNDIEIGKEQNLLLNATRIGINELSGVVKKYSGAVFPAHIDRNSYSIISVLGTIPEKLNYKAVEITKNCDINKIKSEYRTINSMKVLSNSDAHNLQAMCSKKNSMDLDEISCECIINNISKI